MSRGSKPPLSPCERGLLQALRRRRSSAARLRASLTSRAEEKRNEDGTASEPPNLDALLEASEAPREQVWRAGSHEAEVQKDARQIGTEVAHEQAEPKAPMAGRASEDYARAASYYRAEAKARLDHADTSSLYSERTARSVIRVGQGSPPDSTAVTPSHSRVGLGANLPPSRSTVISPALERPVLEYSPASIMSFSPMARFASPSGSTASHGTGPSQRILATDSTGRSQQTRLAYSTSSNRVGDTSRAELRPPPLRVQKQRPAPKPHEAERCSRMWQGLSDEIGEKMAELGRVGEDPGPDDDELLERSALGGPLTPSIRKKVRHMSLQGFAGLARGDAGFRVTKSPQPSLQRTASAMLVPDPAAPTAQQAPPFAMADSREPSGFTPRHRRAGAVHVNLPDSPTLPAKAFYFGSSAEKFLPRPKAQPVRQDKGGYTTAPSASASSSRAQPLDSAGKAPVRGPNWDRPGTGPVMAGGEAPKYSSFALDKSKHQDSVTVLPELGAGAPPPLADDDRRRGRTHATEQGAPRSYFDHSPDAKPRLATHRDKAKALFHASAPLAFQRLSTTARLASAIGRRDAGGKQETSSPTADSESRPARTSSSTFGHFFRKYSRTKSDHESPAFGRTPPETSPPLMSPSSFPARPSEAGASLGGPAGFTNSATSAQRSSAESLVGLRSIIDEVSRPCPPPALPGPSQSSRGAGQEESSF